MALHFKFAAIAATAALMGTSALAQGYPDRQITMIVPFAAGGPTDTVGRLIAEKMSAARVAPLARAKWPRPRLMATTFFCITSAWPLRPRYIAIWPTNRWTRLNMWAL